MGFFVLKIVVSALIIAGISWLAGKNPTLAGFLIALPILSVMAIGFSYFQYRDMGKINEFAAAIPVACDGRSIEATVSIGVALAHEGESTTAMVARADAAMYDAKKHGGNQIITVEAPFSHENITSVIPDPMKVAARG